MIYPDDCTMLMLVAHLAGDSFTVGADGELSLTVRSEGTVMRAPAGSLDELLEVRKWIELRADGETVATDAGRYWVTKWLTERCGKGVLRTRVRRVVI